MSGIHVGKLDCLEAKNKSGIGFELGKQIATEANTAGAIATKNGGITIDRGRIRSKT